MSQSVLLTAIRALSAWELGESGGGFDEFRRLTSPRFCLFSHPDRRCGPTGVLTGPEALLELQSLMAARELRPNRLTFSDVVMTTNDRIAVALFNVAGQLGDGSEVVEHDAVAFTVDGERISGLCAYRGGGRTAFP